MAESTLSISRTDLVRYVGRFLGYGTGTLDTEQTQDVTDCIDRGLRQFYQPPVLEGEGQSHTWSFMKPVMEIGIAVNQRALQLPDDFGGFLESFLYFAPQDDAWQKLPIVGIGQILNERQFDSDTNTTTGVPELAAVVPIGSDGTNGQRFALELWPSTDSTYTIRGQYYSNPYQISTSKPYPLGGQPHAETLIESCLAIAEQMLNDEIGLHTSKFTVQLRTSISHDRRMTGTKHFGYNADRSGRGGGPDRNLADYVTHNGTLYLG